MNEGRNRTVLFVSPLPPPAGGISMWTKRLFERGLPGGYACALVDTRMRGGRKNFEAARLSTAEVQRNLGILADLFFRLALQRPDLVHINCSLSPLGVLRDAACGALARRFGIPVVSYYRGDVPGLSENALGGAAVRALSALVNLSSVNIAMNEASRARLAALSRAGAGPVVKVPSFADDWVFEQAAPHAPHARVRALYVGVVIRAKGCPLIVEVARRMPEMDFVLLGVPLDEMAEDLRNAPPNVSAPGGTDHAGVVRAMCASDIFLFPTEHAEGFPNAVLEAMAVGLPVVATSQGAIPEMIEHGRGGLLVERGNAEAVEAALRGLAAEREQRIAMGAFNRARSQARYSYRAVAEQLVQIYDRVLLDSQSPSASTSDGGARSTAQNNP